MLNLYYSNRLEALVDPLATAIRERDLRNPLETAQVVVPNQATAQWLKLTLANVNGVAANIEFSFLNRLLRTIGEEHGPTDERVGVLSRHNFSLLFYNSLRSFSTREQTSFADVKRWVERERLTPTQIDGRVWELSRALGDVFHEYAFNRRDWLEEWAKWGRRGARKTKRAPDSWEADLFAGLVRQSDGDRPWSWMFDATIEPSLDAPRRDPDALVFDEWTSLPEALSLLADAPDDRLPRALHLFNPGQPGHTILERLTQLARRTEVNFYVQNPSLEFWEDVRDARLSEVLERQRFPAKFKAPTGSADDEDVFGLQANIGDPPLLRLWGRSGRELVAMLNELSGTDFTSRFVVHDLEREQRSLLQNLQDDVLHRRPAAQPEELRGAVSTDGTVSLVGAVSRKAELEHVAMEIEALLDVADSSGRTAAPTDFCVAIAGDLDAYLSELHVAFDAVSTFPREIVGAPLATRSTVGIAVLELLSLLQSEFSRKAFSLVVRHAAQLAGGDDQVETWERWFDETALYFGEDASDFDGTYLEGAPKHWTAALQRVGATAFLDRDDVWCPANSSANNIAPLTSVGLTVATISDLIRLSRSLLEVRHAMRSDRTLQDWTALLVDAVRVVFEPVDPVDQRALQRVITAIDGLAELDPTGQLLPATAVMPLVREAVGALEARSAVRLTQGVRIGPLAGLAGLPHKHTWVVGLNAGEFPSMTLRSSLDLRGQHPRRAGDVRSEERDRYRLLTTLLSTTDSITFSWLDTDESSGERIESSTVVEELRTALRVHLTDEQIKERVQTRAMSAKERPDAHETPSIAPQHRLEAVGRMIRERMISQLQPGERLPTTYSAFRAQLDRQELLRVSPLTRIRPIPEPASPPEVREFVWDARRISDFIVSPTEVAVSAGFGGRYRTRLYPEDPELDDREIPKRLEFSLLRRAFLYTRRELAASSVCTADGVLAEHASAVVTRVLEEAAAEGVVPWSAFHDQVQGNVARDVGRLMLAEQAMRAKFGASVPQLDGSLPGLSIGDHWETQPTDLTVSSPGLLDEPAEGEVAFVFQARVDAWDSEHASYATLSNSTSKSINKMFLDEPACVSALTRLAEYSILAAAFPKSDDLTGFAIMPKNATSAKAAACAQLTSDIFSPSAARQWLADTARLATLVGKDVWLSARSVFDQAVLCEESAEAPPPTYRNYQHLAKYHRVDSTSDSVWGATGAQVQRNLSDLPDVDADVWEFALQRVYRPVAGALSKLKVVAK